MESERLTIFGVTMLARWRTTRNQQRTMNREVQDRRRALIRSQPDCLVCKQRIRGAGVPLDAGYRACSETCAARYQPDVW